MSSSWMRSSSLISASFATISVRRLSAYFARISSSSITMTSKRSFSSARMRAEPGDGVAERRRTRSASFSLLEPRQAREAHLEDGLGLPLGEEYGVALLRLVDLRLRPPGARARTPRAPRAAAASARSCASSVSRAARMVRTTRSTSVIATPSPSMISRCASACRSSKRDRRVTTSRRCSTNAASVSLQVRGSAGRPWSIARLMTPNVDLQIGHPVELVDDHLRHHVLLQLDDEADAVAVPLVARPR